MLAVEFETHVENGVINIPEQYREVADGDLRIIILKQEKDNREFSGKQKKITGMKKLLEKIQTKNVFQNIADPLEWQRDIRDDWS